MVAVYPVLMMLLLAVGGGGGGGGGWGLGGWFRLTGRALHPFRECGCLGGGLWVGSYRPLSGEAPTVFAVLVILILIYHGGGDRVRGDDQMSRREVIWRLETS